MALGGAVLSQGSPQLQTFLIHLATNSIHYRWDSVAPSAGAVHSAERTLHMLKCAACDATLDLCHLVVCKESYVTALHSTLQRQLLDILEAESLSRLWATRHRHLPLIDVLDLLFPPPPAASIDALQLHHTSALCGSFTRSAQSHAIRLVGLAKFDDAPLVFLNVRLAFIKCIRAFFAQLHLSIDD